MQIGPMPGHRTSDLRLWGKEELTQLTRVWSWYHRKWTLGWVNKRGRNLRHQHIWDHNEFEDKVIWASWRTGSCDDQMRCLNLIFCRCCYSRCSWNTDLDNQIEAGYGQAFWWCGNQRTWELFCWVYHFYWHCSYLVMAEF